MLLSVSIIPFFQLLSVAIVWKCCILHNCSGVDWHLVIFSFWVLWIKVLWIFVQKTSCGYVCISLWKERVEWVKWLDHTICRCLNFYKIDSFPKWLYLVKFPLGVHERSSCFDLGPHTILNMENHKQLFFVYVENIYQYLLYLKLRN